MSNEKLTQLLDEFLAKQRPSDEGDEISVNFGLTRRQVEKVQAWMETVEAKVPSRPTAIGGRYTYAFTPNSIGVVCVVQDSDSGTGETLDVSDYEDW